MIGSSTTSNNHLFNTNHGPQVIELSDEALQKTYTHRDWEEYKTNLLGLDPLCDCHFKIIPIQNPNFNLKKIDIADIQQSNMRNCSFLSALRSILRRYPDLIVDMLEDVDDKHFSIKLFYKENETYQPVIYKIQKTIVVCDPAASLFSRFHSFFYSYQKMEADWVKLIEKAFVLHCMRTTYHPNLINIQCHGRHILSNKSKKVIPSYEDVVKIHGNDDIYSLLLGLDCKKLFHATLLSDRKKILQEIKEKWLEGEIVLLSFRKNNNGLETEHSYELVSFVNDNNNQEFVVLSNPWGNNPKGKKIDFSKFKMTARPTLEQVHADDSILMVPIDNFHNIINDAVMTGGIKNLTKPQEKNSRGLQLKTTLKYET